MIGTVQNPFLLNIAFTKITNFNSKENLNIIQMQDEQIQRIFPQGIPAAVGPYSPATKIGNLVFISGQIPINPETGNIQATDIQGQTEQVMKNLKKALEGSGCLFSSVAKTTILLTDLGFFSKVNQIYSSYFQKGKYPARICYEVKALPKESLIEIDCIATTVSEDSKIKGAQPEKKVKLDL